eukprot:3086720-Karenia_brevis.AAC.1
MLVNAGRTDNTLQALLKFASSHRVMHAKRVLIGTRPRRARGSSMKGRKGSRASDTAVHNMSQLIKCCSESCSMPQNIQGRALAWIR